MALSGEEIRQRLGRFASKWSVYKGSERAEAQSLWHAAVAHDPDEANARLYALNQEIAAGESPYDPFGGS